MESAASGIDSSLIIPCYNEESIFWDSIKLVLEALERPRLKYEIISIDDCS